MYLLRKVPKAPKLNEPLRHPDHPRPITRRELIAQGFLGGSAVVIVPAVVASLLRPGVGKAQSLPTLPTTAQCGISAGAGKIPFICFDLSGGANTAGSNVIVGGQGGQMDFISSAGYTQLGLPGDMLPNSPNKASASGNFIDSSFGLAFHSDSAVLRGMKMRTLSAQTSANTNGVIIPAMSSTDTSTNPHNPMYGIWRAGANGQLLTLIGSEASVSGGNSVAPSYMIDLSVEPTKVSQASDVTGLVNTGQIGTLFPDPTQRVEVLNAMANLTQMKLAQVDTKLGSTGTNTDAAAKSFMVCQDVKTSYLAGEFSSPSALDPGQDPLIVGAQGIFSAAEYASDNNFQKTAAVMKMVVDGYAGAGTIQMGGYDYHTGERATGEAMDFEAGQCIGACLEYAARAGKPLMVYVFSDGSLASNGMIDNSVGGRGKCVWTADNSTTSATYFLVYNPTGRAQLADGLGGVPAAQKQQIGFFNANGSVNATSSPAANAVNLLCETVILNYMALHGEAGNFMNVIPQTGLTTTQVQDQLIAFQPIVNGVIS
jgi:hypothetical protein